MIREIFQSYIYDNKIFILGKPDVIPNQYISIEDFCTVFGVTEDVSLDELIAIDHEKKLGDGDFFNKVKSS